MLLWPSHFLPWAFISFQVLWCKKYPLSFLPDPKFQSNFLFCDKLVISICWNIICHHLLLNPLAWTGNLEMPPLMMSFVGHLSVCFRKKDNLKIQKKANLFRKNRGSRRFQLESSFPSFSFPSVIEALFLLPQSHTYSGLISQTSDPKLYQVAYRRQGWVLGKFYWFVFILNQSCSSQGLNNTSKDCDNLKSTLWRLVVL